MSLSHPQGGAQADVRATDIGSFRGGFERKAQLQPQPAHEEG